MNCGLIQLVFLLQSFFFLYFFEGSFSIFSFPTHSIHVFLHKMLSQNRLWMFEDQIFWCNQIPSTNRNTWFPHRVLSIYYKDHDSSSWQYHLPIWNVQSSRYNSSASWGVTSLFFSSLFLSIGVSPCKTSLSGCKTVVGL